MTDERLLSERHLNWLRRVGNSTERSLVRHIYALTEQLAAAEGRYVNQDGKQVSYQEAVQYALQYELERHTQAVIKIMSPKEGD